ncbi:unnamed protein product, partial [Rotaria sp. Silwood1]
DTSVFVSTDTKNVYEDNEGTGKAFTTAVICENAACIVFPCYTIDAEKNMNILWCQQGRDHLQYHCSNKGWITKDLFTD